MAITGNLRTMQLSELLQWLSMGQKTGTLAIRGATGEKTISFEGGRIISSSSTNEREYLGHFLVSFGYITEDELTRAMEVQEESKILLGKILVMIGAVSEDELAELIRMKAAETIYDIFLWKEGAFHFIDGEIPTRPMVPISLDVTGIVMEGLRRFDEWQRIRTRLPSHREVPVIVQPVPLSSLPERERYILQAIDGVRSLKEIGEATHNADFHVAKLVFELLESGHAELGLPKPEAPPPSSELTPEDPYETVFEDAVAPPYPLADAADEFAPPPEEVRPVPKDFSRFLRKPTEASGELVRPAGPITTSFSPVQAPARPKPAETLPPPPSVTVPVPPRSGGFEKGPRSGGFDRPAPPRSGSIRVPPRTAARESGPPSLGAGSGPRSGSFAPPGGPSREGRPAGPVSVSLTGPPTGSTIAPHAVPSLTKPMEELMSWSFTPNEAFIVSRINGIWDVRSIAKISPFPEAEVYRVFERLHGGGLVRWR